MKQRTATTLSSDAGRCRQQDVQLARYILQIAVPAAFAVIAVLRVFAGLPALTSFRRIWLPWLLVSVVLSGPIVLM